MHACMHEYYGRVFVNFYTNECVLWNYDYVVTKYNYNININMEKQNAQEWMSIIIRIMLFCGSLFLMCDAIVKTKGLDTKRCFCFLSIALILTVIAFIVTRRIIKDTYCGVCGGTLALSVTR